MRYFLTFSFFLLICNFANAQRYSTDLLQPVTDVRIAKTNATLSKIEKGGPLSYSFTTNLTNPSCDTGFTGYVDLEGFGIFPQAAVIGDDASFTGFGGQDPIRFYGTDYVGLTFSTNGLVHFGAVIDAPNTGLPSATDPNNIIAMFWNDMEVFYDGTAGNVQGVTLATAGPNVTVIEFDDPQPKGGGPSIGDFEIIVTTPVINQPNTPEFVIAFDNIGILPASATVGMEDATGTEGTQFLFGDPSTPITSGLIVCFEAEGDLPVELMSFDIE